MEQENNPKKFRFLFKESIKQFWLVRSIKFIIKILKGGFRKNGKV